MMKFIKFLLSQKKYLKNPEGNKLSKKEQKALLLGLVLSEQNGFYCDTLETGKDDDKIKIQLKEYYEITDKKSAKEQINNLFKKGSRYYFDKLKESLIDNEFNLTKVAESTEELEILKTYQKNILETTELLESYEFLENLEDFKQVNYISWDLGRIVYIARCSFECGYLKEKETWEVIEHSYEVYKKNYKNIADYAKSYAIARAIFAGYNNPFISITALINDLIIDKNSPWTIFNDKKGLK